MRLIKFIIFSIGFVFIFISCENKLNDNSNFDSILKAGTSSSDYSKGTNSTRLVSYNVRHCEGMDNIINYDRIANIIDSLHPDVVCLQELDSVTTRSNKIDQLKMLGNKTGMRYYFGSARSYQEGKYGIGILSKEDAISVSSYALPGSEEVRTVLVAEFSSYIVMCTHLSLTEVDRVTSVGILTQLAKTYKKNIYLAGDFNEPNRYGSVFKAFFNDWNQVSTILNTFSTSGPSKLSNNKNKCGI